MRYRSPLILGLSVLGLLALLVGTAGATGARAQGGAAQVPEGTETLPPGVTSQTVLSAIHRAVFERHPENAPPYDVLLAQLGTFRYQEKGGTR